MRTQDRKLRKSPSWGCLLMHAMAWGRVLNRCVHITHTYIGTVDTCLVFQWSMNFLKLLNIEILVSHPGMNQGIPSKGKISRSWSNSRSSVSGTSICNMVYTIARQYTWLSPSLGPDRHPENRESASHMLRYWDKSFVSSLVSYMLLVVLPPYLSKLV